jgi:hypothetical protein
LLLSTKAELTVLTSLGSELVHVTLSLLVREVLFDDVVSLHVDLFIGVVLTIVNLLHTTALLDEESVAIDGRVVGTLGSLLVHVTDLEDVLKTVKSDLDDLVVGAREQLAQGADGVERDEVTDLVGLLQATGSGVGDGPAGLLASLEVSVREEMNQGGHEVGVNDGLDLCRVASGNVGDGPACLLANAVLSGAQKRKKSGKGATVDDDLGLNVVASDNVSDGTKGRGLDRGRGVHEELDQTAGNVSLDDGLNLVVGAVGKV